MGWDLVTRIRTPHTGIDVTPFIGVVMTLLIVSMALTPAIACGPKLPRAHSAVPMKENRVTLGVDNQGKFWISDVANPGPVPSRHLAARVGTALAAHPAEERDVIYLEADVGVPYHVVQTALDAVRANGIRRVGLIVGPTGDPLPVDL